jgi:hypothetical protein
MTNINEVSPIDAMNTIPVTFKLSKLVEIELLSCFSINSFIYPGFHPIWDVNTNEFLSRKLGIVTDCPVYNLNDSYQLFFDWSNQIWYVG